MRTLLLEPVMKIWMVFAYDDFYPGGGAGDFVVASLESAGGRQDEGQGCRSEGPRQRQRRGLRHRDAAV